MASSSITVALITEIFVDDPEGDPSPIGGPSAVISPTGEVVQESIEGLVIVRLDREAVDQARVEYPGYLDHRPEVYGKGWTDLAKTSST